MNIERLRFLLELTHGVAIARRYFVTNGFDGALTMLGLNMGFFVTEDVPVPVMLAACVGTAVALGVSGVSSAYVSEAAEKAKELQELESAMVKSLQDSAHGQAARFVPWLIAAVNGLSPLVLSLFIIAPLMLANAGIALPMKLGPVEATLFCAFVVIFLLGVFLGRLSGKFWLVAGLRTTLIALITSGLILLVQ